jgi:cytochrome P450
MLITFLSFCLRQIDYTLVFTQRCIESHQEELKQSGKTTGPIAMLTRYLDAHNQNPSHFTYNDVLIGALTGIVAGGDTTEITLGSVFHYLHSHPATLSKLRAEISSADAKGEISDPITYAEAKTLPYLNAVIKEAQRMHSAVGTPLWRTVPEPGFTLANHFFNAGTTVGVNVWVSQHSQAVYVPDPDTFRPERWLESDAEKLAAMEKSHIVFGVGPRNCQGQMIALMEMSKVLVQLMRRFDFEIKGKWETRNNWFVGYKGLTGRVRVREEDA